MYSYRLPFLSNNRWNTSAFDLYLNFIRLECRNTDESWPGFPTLYVKYSTVECDMPRNMTCCIISFYTHENIYCHSSDTDNSALILYHVTRNSMLKHQWTGSPAAIRRDRKPLIIDIHFLYWMEPSESTTKGRIISFDSWNVSTSWYKSEKI